MRVNTVKKARLDQGTCGRCKTEINKGDPYRWWKFFRSRNKNIRCMKPGCAPRQSELTQSEMSRVYSCQEQWEDYLEGVKADPSSYEPDDVFAELTQHINEIQEVIDAYTEAAEHFGGQGENQERADELEGVVSELESICEPDPDSEDWLDVLESEAANAFAGIP